MPTRVIDVMIETQPDNAQEGTPLIEVLRGRPIRAKIIGGVGNFCADFANKPGEIRAGVCASPIDGDVMRIPKREIALSRKLDVMRHAIAERFGAQSNRSVIRELRNLSEIAKANPAEAREKMRAAIAAAKP